MLRYKPNRQSIIIAALIILLCLVCLVGATLALFTNDEQDGTIGVITTTGTVRVDIVDDSAEHKSLKDQYLLLKTADEEYALFEAVEFEPGALYRTQGFRVKNEGTVTADYTLYLSPIEDEKMQWLTEAFELWITTDPSKPEQALPLEDFEGELAPQTLSPTYYLFIKMKESAGNKFQNQRFEGIGITAYAVQGNVK